MLIVNGITSLISGLIRLPEASFDTGEKIRNSMGEIAKQGVLQIGNAIEGLALAILSVNEAAYTGLSNMIGSLITSFMALISIFKAAFSQVPAFALGGEAAKEGLLTGLGTARAALGIAEKGRVNDIESFGDSVDKARQGIIQGTDKFRKKIDEIFSKDFELEWVLPPRLAMDVLDYGIDDIKDRSFPDTDEWMKELANLAKGTATAFSFAKEKFMDATVGSFGATRNALLRTETKEDKIVNLLGDIAENTGNMADAL